MGCFIDSASHFEHSFHKLQAPLRG
jgi:hypothetical protein